MCLTVFSINSYSVKKAAVIFFLSSSHFDVAILIPRCHSAFIKIHNAGSNGALDPGDAGAI